MLIRIVKSLVQFLRFLQAVVFIGAFSHPRYYYPIGILSLLFGVSEAVLSFWKEIAARVHRPGQPRYFDSPHAAHRGWYS